jgi:hypothetical protein
MQDGLFEGKVALLLKRKEKFLRKSFCMISCVKPDTLNNAKENISAKFFPKMLPRYFCVFDIEKRDTVDWVRSIATTAHSKG